MHRQQVKKIHTRMIWSPFTEGQGRENKKHADMPSAVKVEILLNRSVNLQIAIKILWWFLMNLGKVSIKFIWKREYKRRVRIFKTSILMRYLPYQKWKQPQQSEQWNLGGADTGLDKQMSQRRQIFQKRSLCDTNRMRKNGEKMDPSVCCILANPFRLW